MRGILAFGLGTLLGASTVRVVDSDAHIGTLTLSEEELRRLCAEGEAVRVMVVGAAIIPPEVSAETLSTCISSLHVIGYASMSRSAHEALRGRVQVSGTAVVD